MDYYQRTIYEVLKEFQIHPDHFEKIGKVFKVYSGQQIFALKETDAKKGHNLFSVYPILYHKGFYRFVPLYSTRDGKFAILKEKKLFYLMPWIGNDSRPVETNHAKKMFQELARLHFLTSREAEIDKNNIEEHFENTSSQWKKEMAYLDRWVEQCEEKWYMSPFEWEFVQYYNEFRKAYEYAHRTLENWKNTILDTKKIRTVLVHGKVSLDHFVFDEKGYGYFINFDESRIGASYQDLLPFISKTMRSYPTSGEDCINWFNAYRKQYPLSETELLLIKSYLAQPGFIIQLLDRYQLQRIPNHERKYTKQIQQAYWQLKNIENIVMQLEKGQTQSGTSS